MITDNKDAVSPVIGVLLMLVVCIIIAAVVAAFAGGLGGGTDKAPQASVSVKTDLDNHSLIFTNEGGEPFALSSIKMVLQSGTTKTTLTTADIGGNCVAFEEIPDSDSDMISVGDRFLLQGATPSWGTGIDFGSLNLPADNKIEWSIIDKDSDNVITAGSFVL